MIIEGSTELLEWAASGRPIPGEARSGDLHVVAPCPGGVLVGLIDGLGHGPEAAQVASRAAEAIMANAAAPVQSVVEACHDALKGTRGVVLSLASISTAGAALTWIGVGNVEAALFGASDRRQRIVTRGGVVGYRLPPLRANTVAIEPGDVLVFASDGISESFIEVRPTGTAAEHAARMLAEFGKHTDDALVLVARYRGSGL